MKKPRSTPSSRNRNQKTDNNQKSSKGTAKKTPLKLNVKIDKNPIKVDQNYSDTDEIRLNKYIAHAGLCSRREADKLIAAGKVKINGKTVSELGVSVRRTDKVEVDGQRISLESFVYLLLNKPRNTITTTDDERGRNTVLDEVENATGSRVYPVGRLDRNTTGLLLLTNDGDLTHRLMHPSYKVRKTYEVESQRELTDTELAQLRKGVELEDGIAKGHNIQRYADIPKTILISVYEGRNHLIRRMVAHFGTEVVKLKRVEYAGLNLKDVKMGRWRFLRQKEVNNLRKLVKLEALDFKK